MTYEENNKLIQDLMREFDRLYKTSPMDRAGIRFIIVDGYKLSEMEFVAYKLKTHKP